MEKLLASQDVSQKLLNLSRGQKVEGEVLIKTPKELILDLGVKSEGVLPINDLSEDEKEVVKVGDRIQAYVVLPENESGQVTLALQPGVQKLKGWGAKFQNALNKKSKLSGKVLEINKGGLIVEIEGARGFLPNSQVGFDLLVSLKKGFESLIGQNINVTVTEIDADNNRLIFSQRGQVSKDVLEKLKAFKTAKTVRGKVVAILPFGLVVDLDPSSGLGTGGVEGLIFISDVSWEKVEDLTLLYKVGQEVEAQVLSLDEELGRVNLSIKHLSEDPFSKIAQNYAPDDKVLGEISGITEAGVTVKLDSIEGFLPASKVEPDAKYIVGESATFLVDNIDKNKRRVNLAPFVTSTAGLIYK